MPVLPILRVSISDLQREAYAIGFANGERAGYDRAVGEVERVVYNRRGFEVMQEDVDAVRKGAIH